MRSRDSLKKLSVPQFDEARRSGIPVAETEGERTGYLATRGVRRGNNLGCGRTNSAASLMFFAIGNDWSAKRAHPTRNAGCPFAVQKKPLTVCVTSPFGQLELPSLYCRM